MKQQRMSVGKIKDLIDQQARDDREFLDSNLTATPTLESLGRAERAAARYHFCQHLLGQMGAVKEANAAKIQVEKETKEKVRKVVRTVAKRRGRPPKKVQQQ